MRRALTVFAVAVSGCTGLHSSLHAGVDVDYEVGATLPLRCVARDVSGRLVGGSRSLELGQRDELAVAAVDELVVWGRARSSSGVPYTYGQICAAPRACVDVLHFDDGKVMVWLEVATVRPAGGETVFESQLEEGMLISQAARVLTDTRQVAKFAEISVALEAAASTRDSMLSVLPLVGTINEVRTAVSESEAAIGTQLLPSLGRLLDEHSVYLYDAEASGLRPFEVIRALCAGTVSSAEGRGPLTSDTTR